MGKKIEIEKFIEATGGIYSSTVLAFKRARQLADGGYAPVIESEGEKVTTIAIKEVAEKKVISSKKSKKKEENSKE
ncbi:MAG TPA: DNA-directed RNA polymerase subunit omega [Candidatus Mcinerneyibacterium sp.]|nr:DNA-directed RNA polymerase subunit omega [Candidatus Mcinerneyibacterium sp.]